MKPKLFSRSWFYFRQGWSTYFAFIMAAVNTLTVTYYLAIENIPVLKEIFPSFVIYIIVVVAIGIPLLVLIGNMHFKRSTVYSGESDIIAESYPYYYKLTPGYKREALFPTLLLITEMLTKLLENEKITEEDKKQIDHLTGKMNILIKGGYVGNPPKRSV
jgi:hypothetical protein